MDKLEEIKRIFDNAPENNGPKKIADSISISGRSVGVIGNNNTIVQTEKVIHRKQYSFKPGVEHISEEQAAKIKEMVLKIYDVQKAVKKNPPNPRNIWRALNNHCKVTTFRAILATDFEKAMKFLRQRLKIENSSPSAATKNPNWREEHYRSIHSIAKRCGLEERLLNYMKRNFHVEHLRELQNDELMRVYRYIVGAKSRMKNPS